MNDEQKINRKQNVHLFVSVATTILTALALFWLEGERRQNNFRDEKIASLNVELAKITNDRFTSQDGKQVWKAIAELTTNIGKVNERLAGIPRDIPPRWFLAHNETQDKVIERMVGRMDRIEDRLGAMEAKKDGK